ncbi:agip96 [Agrotis ipsilon multiple nucleopolyhedrovirus]|uniref:Ac81 n=1 Tax=Agrotis ipsilon multiple nucleopolyhedrovirus TaxID=208013 RepID=B6D610_9ABAC|nr:agip96 [Agrotis ipsilon multiple nucleopolyhedrovirus]ACI28797.1 unknown [Agrotis ipsilon multiple nucleopolyhedrovirus]
MLTANCSNPRSHQTETPFLHRTTHLQTAETTKTPPRTSELALQEEPPTTTTSVPECLTRCQPNAKNLTALQRIKFDADLLIHYVFDGIDRSENTNVIKVCKVRVKKTCGTLLAHYYAQINISNGYQFEFHPGSQPRTFQQVHTDGNIIMVMMLCDECCKEELRSFVLGENQFNVAFKNCESILCKRKSVQSILITMAILVLFINIFHFSWYYVLFIFMMILLLYLNNNYMISNPQIVFCPHKRTKKQYGQSSAAAKFFI